MERIVDEQKQYTFSYNLTMVNPTLLMKSLVVIWIELN